MSLNYVLVNDIVRITVRFIDTDQTTGEPIDISPTLVTFKVFDSQDVQLLSDIASPISSSEYYYDYTPTQAGEYKVVFTGIMPDSTAITITQRLYVSTPDESYVPQIVLQSDETVIFSADVWPLYIDPELILAYFPDASLLEIGEIVHFYSLEIKEILKLNDQEDGSGLSFIVTDYIKAATACDLSRTYGFGGDDEISLKLGDFSITSNSMPKKVASRDNASTWCQIAASLRREMLAKGVGMRGVQHKGLPAEDKKYHRRGYDPETGKIVYPVDMTTSPMATRDPMPGRGLRYHD
jgi:hypothetical protein